MASLIQRFRLSSALTNVFRYSHANASSSSSSSAAKRTDGETKLNEILKKRFPDARLIDVKDTSCKYRSPWANQREHVEQLRSKCQTISSRNRTRCFSFSLAAGCGASYEIVVVADEFAKMRTVNQHRLVSMPFDCNYPTSTPSESLPARMRSSS